jgi:hypothetical protein
MGQGRGAALLLSSQRPRSSLFSPTVDRMALLGLFLGLGLGRCAQMRLGA